MISTLFRIVTTLPFITSKNRSKNNTYSKKRIKEKSEKIGFHHFFLIRKIGHFINQEKIDSKFYDQNIKQCF